MRLHTSSYNPDTGWTTELPRDFDSENTLLLLFGSAPVLEFQRALIAHLADTFPQSCLVGCSTTSPFANGTMLDNQIVLAICQFEQTQVKPAIYQIRSINDSWQAGRTIGEELYQPDLRQILLFADGRVSNANELMAGINSVAQHPLSISGGMAGHPNFSGPRHLIFNDHIVSNAIVAVGLYGDALFVAQGEDVGLTTYSPYYEVTQHTDRVIHEIDGVPAREIYHDFLGSLADNQMFINMFPIGFYETPDSPMSVVRSILKVDQDDQALVLASEVPPQHYMRFMTGMPSQFIEAAEDVAERVSSASIEQSVPLPLLSLTITCIGRQAAMGLQGPEEPARIFEHFPRHTEQIGFCAYGEIAWSPAGLCELHNHTINITLLGEFI